jgi:pimeloyl-ACP methyl ester carboxylesterase
METLCPRLDGAGGEEGARPLGMDQHGFTKKDGATLTYAVLGSEDAERTLVCHPGGPGMSGAYFGDLCGLGSRDLRVILFNPRGTGESSPPVDGRYELEEYTADLDALRSELGVERIDLLGHSHGGFVGMVYALSYPDRLGRLALVCSAPRFSSELREEAEAAFARHRDQPWFEDAREAQRRRQAWDFRSSQEAAALYAREARLWFASDGPDTEAFLREFARQRPDLEALRYFNDRLAAGYDLRPQLGKIDAPTLVVNGGRDFFGPRISARELAAIPNSKVVVIPHAGHFVFAEAPQRLRAELEAFLGSRNA